jgi:hypothetical protein
VGRVVFGKNAEPEKWFRLDSRLQDISASSRCSDSPLEPSSALLNDRTESASRASVASPSSHPDIIAEFQAAIAASVSSKGSL